MCKDSAKGRERSLDSCDLGVIQCADSFGNEVWPGGRRDDELGEEAVKVGFNDETWGEVMIDSDAVAKGKGEGGYCSSIKCPVCCGVLSRDA